MSAQDLCELVQVGEELRNLEYKGPMKWDDEMTKTKITKAALAMSNIRDGGWIVIGMKELNNGKYERVGLTKEEADTFNHDHISSHINVYADPPVQFHVNPQDCEGKKYVMVKIDEFEKLPVICKKDYRRAELKQGKIYVRTRRKNENSEVSTPDEMREIINLAVDKNTRAFVARLQKVGVIPIRAVLDAEEEAFRKQLGDLI